MMQFRQGNRIYSVGPGTAEKRHRGYGGDSWRITFGDGTTLDTNDLWCGSDWKEDDSTVYKIAVQMEQIAPLPEPKPRILKTIPRVVSTQEKDSYTFTFVWIDGGKTLKKSDVTGDLAIIKEKMNLANHWIRGKEGRSVNVYSPGNFKTQTFAATVEWVKNVCPKGVGLPV